MRRQLALIAASLLVIPLLAGCPDGGGRRPAPVTPTVQPGTYCQNVGQTGITKEGHPMECVRNVGEDKPRWRDTNAVK